MARKRLTLAQRAKARSIASKKGWEKRRAREAHLVPLWPWFKRATSQNPLAGQVTHVDSSYAQLQEEKAAASKKGREKRRARLVTFGDLLYEDRPAPPPSLWERFWSWWLPR